VLIHKELIEDTGRYRKSKFICRYMAQDTKAAKQQLPVIEVP